MKSILTFILLVAGIRSSSQTYSDAQAKAIMESYALENAASYDKAIALLNNGNTADDYFLNLRLGWLYYLKGDFKTAVKQYTKSLTLAPRSIEARAGLMNCYYFMKDNTKVAATARDLMRDDPANYTSWSYLVLIDIANKEYRSGEIRVHDALNFYPLDAKLNSYLAQINIAQGKKDDARQIMKWLDAVYGSSNSEVIALGKLLK